MFNNDFFDLVYATESVEHMEKPANFFREAARVLKTDGILIVTTPSGPMHAFWRTLAAPFASLHRISKRNPPTSSHNVYTKIYERPLSKKELLKGITQAGFEIREYRKSVFLPHESYFQFIPIWLSRCLLFRARVFEKLGQLTSWTGLHHIVTAQKRKE